MKKFKKKLIDLIYDPKIKKIDTQIFCEIYKFNKHDNPCFVTNEKLSKELKVSVRTVQNSINNLKNNDYIRIKLKDNHIRIINIK